MASRESRTIVDTWAAAAVRAASSADVPRCPPSRRLVLEPRGVEHLDHPDRLALLVEQRGGQDRVGTYSVASAMSRANRSSRATSAIAIG